MRVLLFHVCQNARDQKCAGHAAGSQIDPAVIGFVQLRHLAVQVAVAAEQLAGVGKKDPAFNGQRHISVLPLEQLNGQFFFQALDPSGNSCLCTKLIFRRLGKALMPFHGQKSFEFLDIQSIHLPYACRQCIKSIINHQKMIFNKCIKYFKMHG